MENNNHKCDLSAGWVWVNLASLLSKADYSLEIGSLIKILMIDGERVNRLANVFA